MFAGEEVFYFATVRKVTLAFGALFNNITISRYENSSGQGAKLKTIKVPLSYGTGEKWYTHKEQDISAQTNVRTRMSFPRIAFTLKGFQYDSIRKLKTTNTTVKRVPRDSNNPYDILKQLNPVPIDYTFEVVVGLKNMDDGLQILEQIVPCFQPSFPLNIKDIPELNIVKDVPVILNSIDMEDSAQGTFEDNRILEWTFTFTVKGYMYAPIKDGRVIREVIAGFYQDKDLVRDSKTGVVTVKVDPIDADFEDDWNAKTDIYDQDQLDSNGDPIET